MIKAKALFYTTKHKYIKYCIFPPARTQLLTAEKQLQGAEGSSPYLKGWTYSTEEGYTLAKEYITLKKKKKKHTYSQMESKRNYEIPSTVQW